jgi:hypothetical protein
MFPLLASWNEFVGTPMEAPLERLYYESCLQGAHAKQITAQNTYKSTTH